jgi:hypothetical protein
MYGFGRSCFQDNTMKVGEENKRRRKGKIKKKDEKHSIDIISLIIIDMCAWAPSCNETACIQRRYRH